MCGIAGIWMTGEAARFNLDFVAKSKDIVERMISHQGSRGPDNAGGAALRGVVFGHNRLSIVDKSERSNQPLLDQDRSRMLSYNGEIYCQTPDSDTLELFRRLDKGKDIPKVLNGLNGMFAFAYYDSVADVILLARDRFGIKPLYFTHQKEYFAFASTPASVSLTRSSWKISTKGLHEYLSLGATMFHSMFDGIQAVPPGHYLTYDIKLDTIRITRWYYPKFIENAYERIEEKVNQAIDRVKLTCDEPQIILLSGGIDSTLVASRYQNQKAIHLASPEQEFAQKVASRFGIEMFNVTPHAESAEECLTDYISKCGDPTMAGLIPYITCKEIKKLGYRVAITANAADELFFGYDRMKDINEQVQHIFRNFSWGLPFDMPYLHENHSETRGVRQWFEIYTYLAYDLNKTLDFASMCHSVEVRVPYLDYELVEAALSIPQEKHVANFGNKTILKKMLVDLGFDFGFIHRPKVGFSLHESPSDWSTLQEKAMKWYRQTTYEQLSFSATPRQEAYHSYSVAGLYLWHKINKFV